jgi:hypothetical protein
MDVPLVFTRPLLRLIVHSLSLMGLLAELVIGFHLLRWWGLLVWLPVGVLAGIIFPGKNPGPCFFVGVLVVAVGAILLVTG